MKVTEVVKRSYELKFWEPIYISDHSVTPFNEKLTWEGRRDKMVQGFEMCLADYNFMILNNGYVIHRGIKKMKPGDFEPTEKIKRQNNIIGYV